VRPEERVEAEQTTVLVVEDDYDVRDALVPILEYDGHRVASAANGREALEQLRTSPAPSLILLDLMMPVMDGAEFRAEQLRDPALASIPVVVVSADPAVREKAKRLGAAGFVEKPIDIDMLLEQVRRNTRPRPTSHSPSPGTSLAGRR
jgi:CheY-like chemotaxis protein